MPRKAKKPALHLAAHPMPKNPKNAHVIAIVPLEEGVFAWIVEEPKRPRLF